MPAIPEPITTTSHSLLPCNGRALGATSISIQSDRLRRSVEFSISMQQQAIQDGRQTADKTHGSNTRCRRSTGGDQGFQTQRVGRRGALLVVVEINEHVAALFLPGLDAPSPVRKRVGAIASLVMAARSMSPDIDEIGGALPRCRRVVMVRNAQRDVLFGEKPQDAWGIPAGMPEFETVAAFFREQLEEASKPVGIGFEMRRQLKQDGSSLVAEQRQPVLQ